MPSAPPRATERRSLRPVPRALLVLGALCALAFFGENAWQSWGAVHLESDLGASVAVASLAPAVFAGSAALGRLACAPLLLSRAGRRTEPALRGAAVSVVTSIA